MTVRTPRSHPAQRTPLQPPLPGTATCISCCDTWQAHFEHPLALVCTFPRSLSCCTVPTVPARADKTLPVAERRNYKGIGDAFTRTVKEDGVGGLFRGAGPTIARAMSLNMGMFASNEQAKELLVRLRLRSSAWLPFRLLYCCGCVCVKEASGGAASMCACRLWRVRVLAFLELCCAAAQIATGHLGRRRSACIRRKHAQLEVCNGLLQIMQRTRAYTAAQATFGPPCSTSTRRCADCR